jgi:hypothetical protein
MDHRPSPRPRSRPVVHYIPAAAQVAVALRIQEELERQERLRVYELQHQRWLERQEQAKVTDARFRWRAAGFGAVLGLVLVAGLLALVTVGLAHPLVMMAGGAVLLLVMMAGRRRTVGLITVMVSVIVKR